MTQLPIISIIPMKPISDAKSRLSPYLGSPDRQRLALNMLRLVIKAASAASKEVGVLGSDPLTKDIARAEGARGPHRGERAPRRVRPQRVRLLSAATTHNN